VTKNRLYFGDNLDVLRRHVKDESVDLIYLDPPFNSNRDYNVLFDEHDGTKAAAQIKAFEDTWEWNLEAEAAYREVVEGGMRGAAALKAFRDLLGNSDLMAYLAMMAPRLAELHRVLKPTGSIYLHCDATASHYLKVLMDEVFGGKNCRREVIWRSGWVSGFKTAAKNWIRNHDVLLYYVKDVKAGFTFNKDLAYKPHAEGYQRRGGGENPKGVAIDDVWDEVELYSPWIKSFSTEKLGYATQKPRALLDRIVSVSSNPGDVVLDPFCGCGTTIASAEHLGRRWIGIDITYLAVSLMKHRLGEAMANVEVIGEPVAIEDARELAAQDKYQFQWWALGLVGARPIEQKKGADKGIDGRIFFHDDPTEGTKNLVISVKGGKLKASDVRDLRGVIEREGAAVGALISLEEPTKKMRQEAAEAGFYSPPYTSAKFPRLQLLTVEQLLDGKKLEYPGRSLGVDGVTLKTAGKAHQIGKKSGDEAMLDIDVEP
jgi:site-specific DNA-methyltransferase (adenine-specific)